MENFVRSLAFLKLLVIQVTEAGFALIAFMILIYLLLGENSGAFVISVMANISIMVDMLSPEALIGVAMVLLLGYFLKGRV